MKSGSGLFSGEPPEDRPDPDSFLRLTFPEAGQAVRAPTTSDAPSPC